MLCSNVTCRTPSVDKTSTAKMDSASHISDDLTDTVMCSARLHNLMETEQLFGESCLFLFFRSKKMETSGVSKGSGFTFHKNRWYTRTVFYQCNLPILSDGSVPLEWQPDMLQPSTRAVISAMAHHCTVLSKVLLHCQRSFIIQRLQWGSTIITLVPTSAGVLISP
jgi:hypothetical protein